MKKRSCLTRTDLGSSTVIKRTESDLCWKRNNKSSEIHPFKGDQESHDNCLNVYQQLTRSYSWLKQNVFHSPDAESIVISNKKIKHVLKEFNNRNILVQNSTMASERRGDKGYTTTDGGKTFSDEKDEQEAGQTAEEGATESEGIEKQENSDPNKPEEIDSSKPDNINKPEDAKPKEGSKTTVSKPEDAKSKEGSKVTVSKPEDAKSKEGGKPEDAKSKEGGKPEDAKSKEGGKPKDAKSKEGGKPEDDKSKEGGKSEDAKSKKGTKPEDPKSMEKKNPEDDSKPKGTEDEEKKVKLSEADERAKNMAQFIEEMKKALAEYAKKDNMTEEDAKEMLKKQEELMAKLSEFEELTKNIQNMAGIENISSSLLGTPTQCREVNPCGPSHFDNFPKVICFDRISQHELGVPNMIVCEPVCKEVKNPCGDMKQPYGKAYPTPDNMKKGFAPDYDAERYIQKDISREMHSTEVIGMLDKQGMFGQPVQNTMRPNMPGMFPQAQTYPTMFVPQMAPTQPGIMQQQSRPGGYNHPWVIPGQQAWTAVGSTGQQPGGMMVPQSGMMGPQQGMMGPQPVGMLGAQGQMRMMDSKPLPATMNPQGQLNTTNPQTAQGAFNSTDPQTSPGVMQAKDTPKQPIMVKTSDAPTPEKTKTQDKTDAQPPPDPTGKPELTIKQQEVISTHTTRRISDGNKIITEHSETGKMQEKSIEVMTVDKPKNEAERSKQPKEHQDEMVGLKKQIEALQAEMKGVIAENRDLQKRVLMCSPEATKQMLRCRTDIPVICRKTLATTPICKLDLYRQLNLPLPSPLGLKQPTRGGPFPQPQLQIPYQQSAFPGKCRREFTNKIVCRRNILRQFGSSGEEGATKDMETMVTSMEEEVKVLQAELNSVQEERRQLEMQKKLLTCTAPAIASKGAGIGSYPISSEAKGTQLSPKLVKPNTESRSSLATPLRDLREQYNKLQQDFQLKVEEISMLRVELDSARRESLASIEKSEEAEARVDELIARLKAVEDEKSKITSNKDQLMELEQQLVLAKQRYKEINEELEELRSQIADQTMQTDDYRKKFLSAQQTVEEQKRQIEMMEMESSRFGEQVTLELQRVKTQFHSKLEELAPLPEILRKTQEKLKETIHLKTLAEKNCLILSQNLEIANEQKEKLKEELDEINRNKNESEAEKASLKINLTDGEKKMEETKAENNKLRSTVLRLEDLAAATEKKYEGKVQECLQLQSQLETLREESARQVSRIKDRYENMRKSLQSQIFELENQLAATRASAKAAQKDRDDIRQKMQAQIIQLNQNFDQAQMRIRSLQSHVNYLKTSYTNIFGQCDKTDSSMVLP